jgi:hypothetical protein
MIGEQAEMSNNPGDHSRIFNSGNDFQGAATVVNV